MTKEESGAVTEQNRLLSRLLSLRCTSAGDAGEPSRSAQAQGDLLVRVSDQVPAGRGLVYTTAVEPGQVLLTLPADLLLNVKSYADFFHPETLPAAVSVAGPSVKIDSRLSSAQLLSLLVARAHLESVNQQYGRDQHHATPKHQGLQLFVQTLPIDFGTVPLVWSIQARDIDQKHSDGQGSKEASWKRRFFRSLLEALPRHSQALERNVRRRFEQDWARLCQLRDSKPDLLAEPALLSSHSELARQIVRSIDVDLFLWAWLCVNSRCVFLPLGLADHADNFTLAPVLDMANHTPDPALECKVRYANNGGLELCAPGQRQQSQSGPSAAAMMPGDECCITYGPHSNEKLLSEYGFVLSPRLQYRDDAAGAPLQSEGRWRGSRYVDVLMDPEVEALLSAQGSSGRDKIELLQNRGYWGEFTIHPYSEPAHPSHRLIPALRLAALDMHPPASHPSQSHKVAKVKSHPGVKAGKKASYPPHFGTNDSSDLDKWEETLTGYREMVSEENEQRAHDLLVELCQARRTHTDEARRHLVEAQSILDGASKAESRVSSTTAAPCIEPDMQGCVLSLAFVKQLLDEEESVLRRVSLAARDQVEW